MFCRYYVLSVFQIKCFMSQNYSFFSEYQNFVGLETFCRRFGFAQDANPASFSDKLREQGILWWALPSSCNMHIAEDVFLVAKKRNNYGAENIAESFSAEKICYSAKSATFAVCKIYAVDCLSG